MPVTVAQPALEARSSVLLLGIAFSFLLSRQSPGEKSSPATRMQQVRQLLKRLPELLTELTKNRRELSLELARLLRQGPDQYFVSALRELKGLSK
jgi:hypothetical protein